MVLAADEHQSPTRPDAGRLAQSLSPRTERNQTARTRWSPTPHRLHHLGSQGTTTCPLDLTRRGLSTPGVPDKISASSRRYRLTKGNPVDPIAQFKQSAKEGWKHFAPFEAITTASAARLVRF